LEAPLNVRNLATVAGTLVVCDGRSSFATCLLALDCSLNLAGIEPETQTIGEFLPLRKTRNAPYLIQGLEMPLNPHLAFEYVARTPADKPIVAVAAARWPSGRIRVAVGGFGPSPVLAMDGKEAAGIEPAAKNAMHDASDPWGSAEYRMDVAATLARRCLAGLDA
jgi:CO/xanthine dehydrogenase FAD-binding subunit